MARRLLEAAFELTDAAHLTRQSQLSDRDQAVRHWLVALVADDGQGETEVRGRLRDPMPPATLTKTSDLANEMRRRFSSTARIMCSRLMSMPLAIRRTIAF